MLKPWGLHFPVLCSEGVAFWHLQRLRPALRC